MRNATRLKLEAGTFLLVVLPLPGRVTPPGHLTLLGLLLLPPSGPLPPKTIARTTALSKIRKGPAIAINPGIRMCRMSTSTTTNGWDMTPAVVILTTISIIPGHTDTFRVDLARIMSSDLREGTGNVSGLAAFSSALRHTTTTIPMAGYGTLTRSCFMRIQITTAGTSPITSGSVLTFTFRISAKTKKSGGGAKIAMQQSGEIVTSLNS